VRLNGFHAFDGDGSGRCELISSSLPPT
jgi:hypothetical protein